MKALKMFGVFILALVVVALLLAFLGGAKWFGTELEAVVFKNSHQYAETNNARVNTLRAQIAKIDAEIFANRADAETVQRLRLQRNVLEIQLLSVVR